MSAQLALIVALALGSLSIGAWVLAAGADRRKERTLERFRGGDGQRRDLLNWLGRVGRRHPQGEASRDDELPLLLARAGWRNPRAEEVFHGLRLLLPLLAMGLDAALRWSGGTTGDYMELFSAGAVGYLFPKWLLRWRAAKRQNALEQEVQMLGSLSRLLLETGLGVQQSLAVVSNEGRRILPESSRELERVIRQAGMGADLGEVLTRTGKELAVADLADLIKLLTQVDRYGGAVGKPFGRFLELLVDRRRTDLQERVSRMSGKMTMVMVLFEFPALLAFLGAPGFISIMRMLRSIGN